MLILILAFSVIYLFMICFSNFFFKSKLEVYFYFTRYLHDLVMPAEEYSPLQQLLLEPGLTSVKTLAEICHADRAPLATALLRVFRSEGRETELLIELNSAEVRIC